MCKKQQISSNKSKQSHKKFKKLLRSRNIKDTEVCNTLYLFLILTRGPPVILIRCTIFFVTIAIYCKDVYVHSFFLRKAKFFGL